MPSNGSEGEAFMSRFCYQCKNEEDGGCSILDKAMLEHVADEWVYDQDGNPTCLRFNKELVERTEPLPIPLFEQEPEEDVIGYVIAADGMRPARMYYKNTSSGSKLSGVLTHLVHDATTFTQEQAELIKTALQERREDLIFSVIEINYTDLEEQLRRKLMDEDGYDDMP